MVCTGAFCAERTLSAGDFSRTLKSLPGDVAVAFVNAHLGSPRHPRRQPLGARLSRLGTSREGSAAASRRSISDNACAAVVQW